MIGDNIVKLRKELNNISQKTFGEKLLVSQSLINAVENNTRIATDRLINDICREYKVNKKWLIDGEGEMFDNPIQNLDVSNEVKNLGVKVMKLPDEEIRILNNLVDVLLKKPKSEN